MEVVEIRVGERVADLVEALQVAREAERDAELVPVELVGDVEAPQRAHQVLVGHRHG